MLGCCLNKTWIVFKLVLLFTMKKKYLAILFCSYIVLLLIATVIPWSTKAKVGIDELEFRLDYFLHLGAYFGVAFLLIIWQFDKLKERNFSMVFASMFFCLAFAFSTEVLQMLVPYRNFNPNDFIANASGIFITYLLFIVFRRRLRNLKLIPMLLGNQD